VLGCQGAKESEKQVAQQVACREVWASPELPGEPAFGSFSSSGERVAVQVIEKRESRAEYVRQQLWIVGKEYAKPLGAGPSDVYPDWSPKSDEIVYLDLSGWKRPKNDQELMKLRDPSVRVVVADASTEERRILQTPPGYYGTPRWSPDGRAIAVGFSPAAASEESKPDGLLVVRPEEHTSQIIPTPGATPAHRGGPSWSSDSERVLLLCEDEISTDSSYELWIAELDAGKAARVARVPVEWPYQAVGAEMGSSRESCYYLAKELSWPPGSKAESALVLQYDQACGQWDEVTWLSSEPGWAIGAPHVNDNVTCIATNTTKVIEDESNGIPESRILWRYHGQTGSFQLPAGTRGAVLCWSRDGRRIAVSEVTGDKGRVVVYEFR